MSRLTAQQLAEKWNQRIKAGTDAITQGVNAVTKSPTVSAAEKENKFRANLLAAIDSGKWKRGLLKVTVDEWKKSMIERGISRIPAGADGALDDMSAFFAELIPFQDSLSATIAKMPDVTLEDSIARMTAQVRGMAKFTRKA